MELLETESGYLSLRTAQVYHTLHFQERGWLAVDLVQHLDDVLKSDERQGAVLKLLGFTLQLTPDPPGPQGTHWIIVDLDDRVLKTNSQYIRLAVSGGSAPHDLPFPGRTLQRIHRVLDRFDFTVALFE